MNITQSTLPFIQDAYAIIAIFVSPFGALSRGGKDKSLIFRILRGAYAPIAIKVSPFGSLAEGKEIRV